MRPIAALCWLVLVWPALATAQSAPRGPADIIGGAQRQRASRELRAAGARGQPAQAQPTAAPADPHAGTESPPSNPDGAPTKAHAGDADAATNPHAGVPGAPANPHAGMAGHGGMDGEAGEPPPVSTEREDPTLAAGTILARVVDQAGSPVASAEVTLGIMGADSNRSSRSARTGVDGTAAFANLKVGEGQAYRINVPHQGAKYSSSPFRLPQSGGYRVEIRRLPVTQDDRMVVLYVGATSIEIKDDRLKVVQQVRLINLGAVTYAFPGAGTLVRLPKGFMAIQTEDVMGDQHVVEQKGEGLRVSGSLPPGDATLLWGFDLPLAGTEATLSLDLPWTTFAYRVISDAPAGLTLSVGGMPEATLHEDEGRRFLITELQRKVGDAPFQRLTIVLRGIPGPGPERFVASGVALLLIGLGTAFAMRTRPPSAARVAQDVEAQKAELLARARLLQAQRHAGEIGPDYQAEEIALLVDALASLLLEDNRRRSGSAKRA
jgi:hypothetical protein